MNYLDVKLSMGALNVRYRHSPPAGGDRRESPSQDARRALLACTPMASQQAGKSRVAGDVPGLGAAARNRLAEILDQLGAIDRAVYAAVATTQSPSLDRAMRRLSQSANHSALWLSIASGLALTGPAGRRAAVRGVLAIAVTSAAVNLGMKSLTPRHRPDRAAARVLDRRHVTMPTSASFPSGHSASAFAFATAISRDAPWLAIAIQFLAGAVAYSRVHTGVHYPGDTIAGALLGAGAGQAVSSLFDRAATRP